MYARDVPLIRDNALRHPRGIASMCTFVLLSIRQPFASLGAAIEQVKQSRDQSPLLFGAKREGYRHVWEHSDELQDVCRFTRKPAEIIDYLATTVPGLGIVKSAFVAQMLGHDVACFDSRNLETCEMPTRAFREFRGKGGGKLPKPETRLKRINSYIDITRETGGAEHWWDYWCNGIAPSLQTLGTVISARHVTFAGAFL